MLSVVILGYNLGITITIVGPCNLIKHSNPTCLMEANLAMAICTCHNRTVVAV